MQAYYDEIARTRALGSEYGKIIQMMVDLSEQAGQMLPGLMMGGLPGGSTISRILSTAAEGGHRAREAMQHGIDANAALGIAGLEALANYGVGKFGAALGDLSDATLKKLANITGLDMNGVLMHLAGYAVSGASESVESLLDLILNRAVTGLYDENAVPLTDQEVLDVLKDRFLRGILSRGFSNLMQRAAGQDDLKEKMDTDLPEELDSAQIDSYTEFGISQEDLAGLITDGSHLQNGVLKPNCLYQSGENGYLYRTDQNGCIVQAYAHNLQFKQHDGRLRHNPNTFDKERGDDAGHLFADRFGGSADLDNLVSQSRHVNRSQFAAMENQWARALKEGKQVSVNIEIQYKQGSRWPTGFVVLTCMDGQLTDKKIIQQSNKTGGRKNGTVTGVRK